MELKAYLMSLAANVNPAIQLECLEDNDHCKLLKPRMCLHKIALDCT